jgi:hypothetical protein
MFSGTGKPLGLQKPLQMPHNPHPLTSSTKQKLAYNLPPLLDRFARPSLTSLLWPNLQQASPKIAFNDNQMALSMEIDPVNAVLALLGFIIGVILLGLKIHTRRHQNCRCASGGFLMQDPSTQYYDQHVQSTQPGQQRGINIQLSNR